MRVVSGRGGTLYLPSAPAAFERMPMEDTGDGFDWRVTDRSRQHWVGDGLVFHADGEQLPARDVVEVHHRTGRVGFRRCLRGRSVACTGVCLPLARVAVAERWELRLEFRFDREDAMGGDGASLRRTGASALLHDLVLDSFYLPHLAGQRVELRLPFGSGCMCAAGAVASESLAAAADKRADPLHVLLEEELRYVPC